MADDIRIEAGAGAEALVRHDWTPEEALALLRRPFLDLVFEARRIHRIFHPANAVQMSELLSIKTGGCPEDCAYCPQSQRYQEGTGLKASPLMPVDEIVAAARRAKADGATRFCMGAAWRALKDRDLPKITDAIRAVKAEGLETCMTLGMLTREQAKALKEAGLDYYNHNVDTSPAYYERIITTRTMADRLATLEAVREAGIRVCCGGIIGLGESEEDRAAMLALLAGLDPHPESVPINRLVRVPGTPLAEAEEVDGIAFVRVIAAARIMMPRSMVRLSAGREQMSDELQALCFLAGANSIFVGERLLTTPNPGRSRDEALFAKLGLVAL
ncbi:MAG: biotin synthase [Rhodothalassiaceae bacterium]|nr:MAG: biotin synthase [Rhodothalassiaceae bacterium]